MIIIGEKLNGSIPSVAKAIAEKDADLIRERAKMQADAGADFLDVCASVEEEVEVETLKWDDRSCTGGDRYTDLCRQPKPESLRRRNQVMQKTGTRKFPFL